MRYTVAKDELVGSLDDIKYFRISGELGSFRKAAGALGVSAQKIKRRIESLERRTGVVLFKRTQNGLVLTVEGKKLFDELQEFWTSALIAEKKISCAGDKLKGEVVLSVTEGLGTFWLIPRIADFIQTKENLTIRINANMAVAHPERNECDIAISLEKPTYSEIKVRRLGYLHVMPFVSPEYVKKRGMPKSFNDILNHRIVEQIADQVPFEKLKDYLGGAPGPGFAAIRTNTSAANFWAVAKGAGIGLLPTYVRAITRRVIPLDIGIKLRRDIWLSYAQDARKINRTEQVMDFLINSFDPTRFPWFGEDFIHPDELDKWYIENKLPNRFEGFIEQCYQLSEYTSIH